MKKTLRYNLLLGTKYQSSKNITYIFISNNKNSYFLYRKMIMVTVFIQEKI